MNLRFFFIYILLFLGVYGGFSQDTTAVQNASQHAITIGPNGFTAKQLSKLYQRAKMNDTIPNLSVDTFLQNFVNNQLLIKKAEKDGKHKTVDFKEEMETLKHELAEYFLEDSLAKSKLLIEAYSRMETEVNVSHILISLPKLANPSDTLEAYGQIIGLRNRINNGESFEAIAKVNSYDKSAAINSGNLGYITAFQTLYEFENMAYSTAVGDISMPFRTEFGYHIIKVNAKRPFQRWRTAHIFVAVSKNANAAIQKEAEDKIKAAYAELQASKNFAQVCKNYSEDQTTIGNGGEFKRLFGTDELEKSFEDALFALKTNGTYTAPVQTSRGWHIIKLIEKQGLKSYDAMFNYLNSKIKADKRNQILQDELIAKLKVKYQFKEDLAVKNIVLNHVDSLLSKNISSKIEIDATGLKNLFQIGNRAVRSKQYFDFVNNEKSTIKQGYSALLPHIWYQKFASQTIRQYALDNLETSNVEYGLQIQEYRENILLNQIYNEQIVDKALSDTLLQKSYFNKNIARFTSGETATVEIIDCATTNDLRIASESFIKSPYKLSIKWRNLLFKKNESQITEDHRQHLLDLAALLQKNPDYQIEILGNIDPEETDSISGNRAFNVEQYLIAHGINVGRIIVKDNSKFKPISKTNRVLNYRTEFVLYTTNKKDVSKLYNSLKNNAINITEGKFSKESNEILKAVTWKVGSHQITKNGRQILVNIKEISPAKTMTLGEAKGKVIKGLIQELQDGLVEKMKTEYPVNIYDSEIKKIK